MPKRGGGRGGRDWRNNDNDYHYEHDNRGHENIRRVSFKPGLSTKKRNNKFMIEKHLLLDDDINMMANRLENRVNLRGGIRGRGRMNSPAPRGTYKPMAKFQIGPMPFYQVVIPYGANHSKEVILTALLQQIETEFVPLGYKISNNTATFFVDNVKVAQKLFDADRKILLPDGYKLITKVRNQAPIVEVNEELKEKMKNAMGRRYNPATKALDLTKFHYDPELIDNICALSRPTVMVEAMNLIYDNIPDLEALNLNENYLVGFDHVKSVLSKFKSLRILYLANNKIPYISSLVALRSLPLTELNLKGNPLITKFQDPGAYVSNIRKRFTKLLKLDEEDLPPQIGFDVGESMLPPRQPSFLVDASGMDLVRTFLTQYYNIYDSDNRQPLLDAYHENAVFSVCANYNQTVDTSPPSEKLSTYIQGARNLIRLLDPVARRRNLKCGKLQVVSALSDLPATEHDLPNSSVDLMVYTPLMMVLTINGVFRERESSYSPKPIRSFHRTLVIVPHGSGYCIQHDMLFVTNAHRDQVEKAFKSPEPAPAPATVSAPASAPTSLDDAQKMQLVVAMCQHSGMNTVWSSECLANCDWDLQRGVQMFTRLHSEGKIPPEAFVKES